MTQMQAKDNYDSEKFARSFVRKRGIRCRLYLGTSASLMNRGLCDVFLNF